MKCVRIDSVRTHTNGAGAAAEGDMSIYNLENSHLIVFDRRSPQINNSRRQPHMFPCVRTRRQAYKCTRTQNTQLLLRFFDSSINQVVNNVSFQLDCNSFCSGLNVKTSSLVNQQVFESILESQKDFTDHP